MKKINIRCLTNVIWSFVIDKLRKFKKLILDNWMFLFGMLLCFLIILFHSMSAGHYLDFIPTNGTFQNYNPVRRLLNGQVPYKEFQDYLGLGHLYVGSLLTYILGGTYQSSLIAFSFLTLLGFSLIIFVIAKVVFKRKEIAIALTNIVVVINIVNPSFFRNFLTISEEMYTSVRAALNVGNSARFVRGLILPLSCIMLWLGKRFVNKARRFEYNWKYSIMVGVVAGISFIWSNDYGISCWLCIAIVYFWKCFCGKRNIGYSLKNSLIEIFTSMCTVFCLVQLLTLGNFINWFRDTFGTGTYQRWYYNTSKSCYIWDIDTTFIVLFQMGICVFYLVRMFVISKKHKDAYKDTFLAYCNMVGVCATQEYRLLSGGDCKEVALSIFFATILFETISFISNKMSIHRVNYMPIVLSYIIGVASVVSLAKDEFIFWLLTEKEGIYIEELDGNLTSLGEDLINTEQFLDGNKFFSTYASAQEVLSDTFQPSGTDYIIHVLGESQREKYLDEFNKQDFEYAATIKESYSDWEYWIQRANWFFYRELYRNWHPVFANSYEMYWAKNDELEQNIIKQDFNVNVRFIDDATAIIAVQCENSINGIADVYIDYEIKSRDSKLSFFNIQKVLRVVNTGINYSENSWYESNYLRSKSAEYVPVPIVNGYGEITVTSNPKKCAYLELRDYKCDTIYMVTSNYIEILDVTKNITENVIHIALTEKNNNVIMNAKALEYENDIYEIKDINYLNGQINVIINGDIVLNEKNIIRIIR